MGHGLVFGRLFLVLSAMLLAVFPFPLCAAILLDYQKPVLSVDPIDQYHGYGSDRCVEVCNLSLELSGQGTLYFEHEPLSDGLQTIPYELVCEDGNMARLLDGGLSCKEAIIAVWATLARPFGNDRAGYSSDISVHLVTER
jgi:hypothetical protein